MIKKNNSLSLFFVCLLSLHLCTSCGDTDPINPPVEEEEIMEPTTPTTSTPTTPSTTPITSNATIAFYNVENLFDTIDDPENSGDNEFLPSANKAWTQDRYAHKLNNIGAVLQGMNYPIVVGLSEVENEQVIADLAKVNALADQEYAYIHEQSPDHRGIDVGLMYRPEFFSVLEWATYQVDIDDPNVTNYTTRDILMVKGLINEEEIYVFVNHWPSRSGGTEASEFRRVFVATELRKAVADIQEADPTAKILIMGDLNDEPTNTSVKDVLGAKTEKGDPIEISSLYNCTSSLDAQGEGSYNYQGNWQMIDQIISSGNLLQTENKLSITNFQVYKDPSLLFNHPTNGPTPDRTYGGDEYYGGYSDHLPVFVEVKKGN